MNCSYVCASCRRRLPQRAHFGVRRTRSASFVSFNVSRPSPQLDDGDERWGGADVVSKDKQRRPRSIPEQQPLRSVEDDFLERLLDGRPGNHVQGPYSKETRKRSYGDSMVKKVSRAGKSILRASVIDDQSVAAKTSTASGAVVSDASSERPMLNLPSQLLLSTFQGIRKHACEDKPSKNRPLLRDGYTPINPQKGRGFMRLTNASFHPSVSRAQSSAPDFTASSKPVPPLYHSALRDNVPVIPRKLSPKRPLPLSSSSPPPLSVSSQESISAVKTPSTTSATPVHKTSASASFPEVHEIMSISKSVDSSFEDDGSGSLTGVNPPTGRAFFRIINNDNLAWRDEKGNKDGPFRQNRKKMTLPEQDNIVHPTTELPRSPVVNDTLEQDSEFAPGSRGRSFAMANAASSADEIILNKDTPLAKAWELFIDLQRQNPSPRVLLKIHRSLSERVVHSWCAGQDTGLQLNPSLVLKRIYQNPLVPFDLKTWTTALWVLIVHTITSLRLDTSDSSQPSTQTLVQELMRLWTLIMKRTATCQALDERGKDRFLQSQSWELLISSEQMREIRTWFSKDFPTRLLQFFPSVRPHAVSQHFDSAALITFLIFRAHSRSTSKKDIEIKEYLPFQSFIAHLLPYSNFLTQEDRCDKVLTLHGSSPLDRSFILNGLSELSENTASLPITKGLPVAALEMIGIPNANATMMQYQLEEQFRKRIGRAVEHQNVARLNSLWRDILSAYSADRVDLTKTSVPVSIYRQMLTAFMALKRPNHAIDTWNAMVQGGIEPTVGAWDAMLKGCGIARDLQATNGIWTKMLESGVRPDAQVWATRIHSLTAGGDWKAGIQAFVEMTSTWADSVKLAYKGKALPDLATIDDNDGVPKPNTQVLNVLVSGLSRYRRHKELVKILGLARPLGITADIYTFNSLLRSAMQNENPALAMKLLAQMQTHGLTPDVATFTMILQSLFSQDGLTSSSSDGADDNTTPEQTAASVLQQMERSGLQANAWTFATLINGLLKGPDGGNIQAAYAVLSHMSTNGIALSSQIYTALVTYHFDQKPTPDIAAVETLLNRARMDSRVSLDGYFFDRLIEGFAKCGEVGRMTAAMAQAGKRGKIPGWLAMTEAVKALAVVGDFARVAEIMATVKDELQSKDEVRPIKGRRDFMEVAAELGYDERLELVDHYKEFGMEEEGGVQAIGHERELASI